MPGDHMMKVYKSRKSLTRYMQHTGCLNCNLKEEKLSDTAERKNITKILIRRNQITNMEDFENEYIYVLLT